MEALIILIFFSFFSGTERVQEQRWDSVLLVGGQELDKNLTVSLLLSSVSSFFPFFSLLLYPPFFSLLLYPSFFLTRTIKLAAANYKSADVLPVQGNCVWTALCLYVSLSVSVLVCVSVLCLCLC
jgi:hypothetical protein